jgi:hypothetical protein
VQKVLDLMGMNGSLRNLHVIPCADGGDPRKSLS